MKNSDAQEKMSKGRVMIVDDDASIRQTVLRALTRAGYSVAEASDGNECLDQVRKGYRGVILMDVVMPGIDGWTTIHTILSEGLMEGNAICMVTGQSEPPPIGIDVEPFITDYLAKPFSIQQLITMVGTATSYLASEGASQSRDA